MDPGDEHPRRDPALTDSPPGLLRTEIQGPPPVPSLSAQQIAEYSGFYREHIARLVTFLRWYGAEFSEAADLAQETMIKAYNHWGSLTRPSAWIRTVASREFIRARVRSTEEATDLTPEPSAGGSGLLRVDPVQSTGEDEAEVLRLLALLPPRQRQVLAWTYDGYTPREIAAELSTATSPLTPEAVRGSLKLARRALAEHLGPGKDEK